MFLFFQNISIKLNFLTATRIYLIILICFVIRRSLGLKLIKTTTTTRTKECVQVILFLTGVIKKFLLLQIEALSAKKIFDLLY
jgi:hypothetical protein